MVLFTVQQVKIRHNPMYALVSILFSDAGNSIFSAGQAHTVYGTAASATKAVAQTAAKLCNTRAIRYWLGNARSSGAPQGHVGMAR